jgi:hypothetical protein
MRLTKGVASGDQGNSLRVVHAHAAKGLTNIEGRRLRITITIRALGVDVDEPHVSGGKRLFEMGGTAYEVGTAVVPDVVTLRHKGSLGTPENTLIRLPCVGTTGTKAEDWESHLLEGCVASQEDQVGPRDGFAILHLDGPQQAAGLVKIGVIGPAVEWSETLLALNGEYGG